MATGFSPLSLSFSYSFNCVCLCVRASVCLSVCVCMLVVVVVLVMFFCLFMQLTGDRSQAHLAREPPVFRLQQWTGR